MEKVLVGRLSDPMINALDNRPRDLGSKFISGHCVMFVGRKLCYHGARLKPLVTIVFCLGKLRKYFVWGRGKGGPRVVPTSFYFFPVII